MGTEFPPMEETPAAGNTSGQGPTAVVPDEIKGWNWGAFLMNWIWAIAHQTWIGLLALIPCVGLVMVIILGVKGSEWAWQNRRFESIEQFKTVQRIWMYWGIGLLIASIIIWIIGAIIAGMAGIGTVSV